jgi:hypothetical protein
MARGPYYYKGKGKGKGKGLLFAHRIVGGTRSEGEKAWLEEAIKRVELGLALPILQVPGLAFEEMSRVAYQLMSHLMFHSS